MVFSSVLFLVYFLPVFLLIYYLLPNKLKNPFVLLASIIFYSWGAPRLVLIILFTLMIDFFIVRAMKEKEGRPRMILLVLSVVMNVGLLVYFKYMNFFVGNINTMLSCLGMQSIHWTRIALPIGISFFTFQKITYTVDVYRGIQPPLKNPVDLAMYILMFPHLIAGPIVRYTDISGQIIDRRTNENLNNRLTGFFRFIIGLSKKVLIANVLGKEADAVFSLSPHDLTTTTAWIGVLAYTFQIYYDFSGYSDMAIGMARMIGFDFPDNFNNPYISQNITEFWRRWHITLGRFMREYLYIPLGGNRVSKPRLFLNLWFVFIISGFWHGAEWTFIIWGAYHGLFLILDRLFLLRFFKAIGKAPSIVITFFITMMGWVIFRAGSVAQIYDFLKVMFSFRFSLPETDGNMKFYTVLLLAFFFAFYGGFKRIEKWQVALLDKEQRDINIFSMAALSALFFVICLFGISATGFNPFIYFRF